MFAPEIAALRERIASLRKRHATGEVSGDMLIEELEVAHEELHVAAEEVRAQQEELDRLRDAQRRSRWQYERLTALLPVAVLSTDSRGIIQTANAAASSVLRVRVDQLLGKPLLVFLDPAHHGGLRHQLGEAVRTGADFRSVVTLRPVHAQPVDVELQASLCHESLPGSVEVTWLFLRAGDAGGSAGVDYRRGLAHALVELSRVPLHDQDVNHVLAEAARICAGALGPEASVSITLGPSTNPQVIATSEKSAQMLDGAQMLADEGPCAEAWRTASEIWSQDLQVDERWQRLASHLEGTNVGGVVALPFGIGEKPVGTFNIYQEAGREVGPELAEAAHLLSGALAALVHEMDTRAELEILTEQLSTALKSRATIDQAKGIIMAQKGCDADEAFTHLVHISSTTNTKVRQVAAELVEMTQGKPVTPPQS